MNKNIKALQDYAEALTKPDFSFEGISKLMGAINQIHYGINTNEKQEIPEDHDCHAEGGESGCDHPSHKGREEQVLSLEE